MTKFDKSKLPSRHVTEGPARAPHRSYLYAMGLSEEEIHQPLVGVATCWNEAAPCNIALNRQAQAVKMGVKQAMGTPREFTTITVTDGIAMGHEGMRSSLASREAIADTVELTMRGHAYDAIVGLAGCDKSLPGMMMAMVRLNTPSVFIYGGSILPGRAPMGADVPEDFAARDLTVQDMFEAVGRYQSGTMSDAALDILERVACPSSGACGGQFTANTMACVSEAIGLALMNSSGMPAPYESRDQYGEASGRAVMNLVEKNIRARDIVTLKSLENAARVVACTGGSTNAGLHLPAIAHEAGIDFYLDDVCEIFRDTPYFVDLKPGGQYVAKDLYEAGGVPVVMKELRKAGLIHEDCMTATGREMGEELDRIEHRDFRPWLEEWINPDFGWQTVLFFADSEDPAVLERTALGQRAAPLTTKLLRSVPGCLLAGFSLMQPRTEILPHQGIFRHNVRGHLCLREGEPETCWFEGGGQRRTWKEREWLVFQDDVLHHASNLGSEPRAVLLADFQTAYYPIPPGEPDYRRQDATGAAE